MKEKREKSSYQLGIRNSKNHRVSLLSLQSVAIHQHSIRNPFSRDFDPSSILALEKDLQKEILNERAHMNMVVKKKVQPTDPREAKLAKEAKKKEKERKKKEIEEEKKR